MIALLATVAAAEPEPAWSLAASREVPLGRAVAVSPSWDGAPAWFTGGPDGLRVLAPDGAPVAQSDALHPVALVVRQLDGAGDPEVVSCGPEGIALVRGSRQGLALPRPLSDEPCEALVAYDLDRYPALASVSGGELVTWNPTAEGLVATRTGLRARAPAALASVAGRVAVITSDGALALTNPTERVEGPIAAVDGGAAFVWAAAAEGATGIVADPRGGVWQLDGPGRRLRRVGGEWVALPLAPERAVTTDLDGDTCPDLLVSDGAGRGVALTGRCVAPVPPPPEPVAEVAPAAPDPVAEVAPAAPVVTVGAGAVRRAPEALALGGPWKVVDVRVGETLSTRVSWGDGRAWRWSSRGGPPGFSVQADGTMDYTASAEDIGRWRASIRSRAWPRSEWSGVEVRVWPAEVPMADDGAPRTVGASPGTQRPRFDGLSAWVGLGAAGGVATADGSRWENLGDAPTGAAVSPLASLVLETRLAGPVSLLAGFDSAPFFTFPSAPDDRTHVFGTLLGVEAGTREVRVGAFGTYGYTLRGAGLRAAITPFEDRRGHATGLELRATWLAPQIGGEGAVSWVWAL